MVSIEDFLFYFLQCPVYIILGLVQIYNDQKIFQCCKVREFTFAGMLYLWIAHSARGHRFHISSLEFISWTVLHPTHQPSYFTCLLKVNRAVIFCFLSWLWSSSSRHGIWHCETVCSSERGKFHGKNLYIINSFPCQGAHFYVPWNCFSGVLSSYSSFSCQCGFSSSFWWNTKTLKLFRTLYLSIRQPS